MPEYPIKPKPTKLSEPRTMYQCPHCNKYFRSPDRHICKCDPETRSCYTCDNIVRRKGYLAYCSKYKLYCRDLAQDSRVKANHGIYSEFNRKYIMTCPYWVNPFTKTKGGINATQE